jgi:hypothetical protein
MTKQRRLTRILNKVKTGTYSLFLILPVAMTAISTLMFLTKTSRNFRKKFPKLGKKTSPNSRKKLSQKVELRLPFKLRHQKLDPASFQTLRQFPKKKILSENFTKTYN